MREDSLAAIRWSSRQGFVTRWWAVGATRARAETRHGFPGEPGQISDGQCRRLSRTVDWSRNREGRGRRRRSPRRGEDRAAPRALMKMDSELLHSPVVGLAEEDEADMSDWNLPLAFMKKRHSEKIEGSKALAQSWRMKDRMKTVSVALVLCLNVGVDPPDVVKTSPCARLECWIDPLSMSPQKALETIGANLQKQYENWQPRPSRGALACSQLLNYSSQES
ncbi:hypothetical protein Z043_101138 [Scleropages formosus]|uniref:Raptor N-terminal CASPase-like domain-containing protein n=1 Tax=Scleropages formosus TaxID=113540 RepID=A0A0P7ZE17_SCLFO|nr:hypothetical protein Z043_101138 [Scleropages formosus]